MFKNGISLLFLALIPVLAIAQDSSAPKSSEKSSDIGTSTTSPEQKVEGPEQQIVETDSRNVSMRCFVRDNGHRVQITASNTSGAGKSCRSTCYYRTSQGYSGTLVASGTVPGNANNVNFGSYYNSSVTLTVTNPGSFSCQ